MARPPVRAERRKQILDAMFEVIAQRGTAGTSITEIADAAGVARGALHYFFTSKDEINCELMRTLGAHYLHSLGASLDRRIANAMSPERRSRLVGDVARWHFNGDTDDVARRLTVWIDFWGQAASHAALRIVIREIQQGARALFRRALVAQRPELGALDAEHMRAHTTALLALVEGMLLQWHFGVAVPREQMAQAVATAASALADAIPSASVRAPSRRSAA
jgi:AcrR family transcriptional regulator